MFEATKAHLCSLVSATNTHRSTESVQAIKKIAEALGIRLTKAKLAPTVPVVGAAVGAGFNAWFLAGVTEAAYQIYRERFLIEKHGEEVAVPVRH